MAIATLAALRTALEGGRERVPVSVNTLATVVGRPYSLWTQTLPTPATPTTAAVPTRATLGALGQQDAATGQLSLIGAQLGALTPGTYWIVDRIVHHGGLSGTVTTAQTTNLPTPALPARATAARVMMALEIYTQIGTTATTVTAAYTTGAGGKTTLAVVFGGTAFREVGRLILLPMQDGNAITTLDSVTVLASTGTAGNFGVTLFTPLLAIHVSDMVGDAPHVDLLTGRSHGGIPEIPDDACLALIAISSTTTARAQGVIFTAEN